MVTGKLKRECLHPKIASTNFAIIVPTFHRGLVGLAVLPRSRCWKSCFDSGVASTLGSYEWSCPLTNLDSKIRQRIADFEGGVLKREPSGTPCPIYSYCGMKNVSGASAALTPDMQPALTVRTRDKSTPILAVANFIRSGVRASFVVGISS